MAKFMEVIPTKEVTGLFEYEDYLKGAILDVKEPKELKNALNLVQKRLQKIYVVPTAN